jgi:type IV conjugative transfer system coupling protein TraD
MLNNFIGGGQVFLHKLRMFGQVFFRTFYVSWMVGMIISIVVHWTDLQKLDWEAFISYKKAFIATEYNYFLNDIREAIGKNPNHVIYIRAKTNKSLWQNIDAQKVLNMQVFKYSNRTTGYLFWNIATTGFAIFLGGFGLIFILWSRFGRDLKSETAKEGSDEVLSAREVSKKLHKLNRASAIKIGNMPLVKDSETMHLLISGASGSGKTNLFHNILPQVEKNKHPAIVIDQTGEMIAKYYNPSRGDIIFNPFDERSMSWDFWEDCETEEDLERFSKILFGFNRKSVGHSNDPFWEQSAEVVFNACAMQMKNEKNYSIETLTAMVSQTSRKILTIKLQGTKASRYLDDEGRTTASSILSVLATCTKPLSYLTDCILDDENDSSCPAITSFSLKEHFENIQNGSKAWLFLSTKPSARALTLPLIACLTELALARLMDIGANPKRRVWFVIDELAALNKLPALSILTAEGRKYGACILAGIQSLNQIYEHYGRYAGSSIFGQFGTNFFFRNQEPEVGKMVSSISGKETITRHQKNTSFGANEFRDGVSYNEQEHNKNLLEYSDLASLAVGECYVLLPEPKVRLAKIEVPQAKLLEKNKNFIPGKDRLKKNIVIVGPSEEAIGSDGSIEDNKGSSRGGNSMAVAIESEKDSKQYKKQRKQNVAVKADDNIKEPKIDGFEYFG